MNGEASSTGLDMPSSPPRAPGKDPSENVQALMVAAVARIDDLRDAESRRVNEMVEAERRRVNEQMVIRAEFYEKLQIAEAKRIDAIRAVDVNAVSVANDRATAQAAVLANQVAASAEALRALVAATAATQAQQLTQVTEAITGRLSALERSSYEGTGKARVADPMIAELATELKALRSSSATSAGSSSGMQTMWGFVAGGVGLLIALAGVAIAVLR